jgi:TRAP-type C4-dicarboxylate transport system permease small subunit
VNQFVLRFAGSLARACEVFAALLVGVAIVVNLAQVLWRYVLNDPLKCSEEVMRYTMAWVAFVAGSAAVFRGEHMAAGMLGGIDSRVARLALHYAILLVMLAFAAILAFFGTRYGLDTGQVSPASGIAMEVPYLSVGVGGILMTIKILCLLVLPPALVPQGGGIRPEDMA